MRVLASRIIQELKGPDHCAVYEADLERFWPATAIDREAKIAKFAEEHGFRLRFYKLGLCAIFDRKGTDQGAAAKESALFAGVLL